MNCPELNIPNSFINRVNFINYDMLHDDGKAIIRGWFDRAWESHTNFGNNNFEALIFLWFSFNGWASCVTNLDKDYQIIQALAANPTINQDFDNFINDENSRVSVLVREFANLLPIFDVKSLRHRGVLGYDNYDNRTERVEQYLNQNVTEFEPKCWKRHRDAGEDLPLDWAHILKAIYKVRCNLFHGQKAAHSEMDRRIVSAAFLALFHFFAESGYLQ